MSRVGTLVASILALGSVRPCLPFSPSLRLGPPIVPPSNARAVTWWARHHQKMRHHAIAGRCSRFVHLKAGGCRVSCMHSSAAELGEGDGMDDTEPMPPHLDVRFQDEHLAVLSKPGGMLMHRTRDSKKTDFLFLQTARNQLGRQVYLVNRIDRGTSGLVVLAFDGPTAAMLQGALASDEASKEYLCVVRGRPGEESFDCHRPLTDKDSLEKKKREAHTTFRCPMSFTVRLEEAFNADLASAVGAEDPRVTMRVAEGDELRDEGIEGGHFEQVFTRDMAVSVLVARLYTGRRHQIRRHLQHAALNLLGDTSYGKGRINAALRDQYGLPRMLLHSWRLIFRHPVTKSLLRVHAPIPADMAEFLNRAARTSGGVDQVQRMVSDLPWPIQPVSDMPKLEPAAHFDGVRRGQSASREH